MFADLVIDSLGSTFVQGFLVVVLLAVVYQWTSGPKLYPGIPVVGIDTEKGFFGGLEKAREDWFWHGREIIDRGLKQVNSPPSLSPMSRLFLAKQTGTTSVQNASKSSRTSGPRLCCRIATPMRSGTILICILEKPFPRYIDRDF